MLSVCVGNIYFEGIKTFLSVGVETFSPKKFYLKIDKSYIVCSFSTVNKI